MVIFSFLFSFLHGGSLNLTIHSMFVVPKFGLNQMLSYYVMLFCALKVLFYFIFFFKKFLIKGP
jgi:hypothetical protein